LEEFINLIETAEKISDVPPLQLPQNKSRSPARPCQATPKKNDFLNSSQSSVGSQPKVPHLNFPSSWSATPTPHRFVGPANSHCGLSVSDMSPHSARPALEGPGSTRQVSSRTADSHRSVAESTPSHNPSNGTDRSKSSFQLPTTVRKGSASSQHSDIIVNLQKNSPFVRKISQEVLPASPDRSPMTQRRNSRNLSSSPEKKSNEPQSKLPPRNPRSSFTGRVSTAGRQSSRHSSSSPDKTERHPTPKSRQSSMSPKKTQNKKNHESPTPKSRQSSSSPAKSLNKSNESIDTKSPKSRTVSSSPSPVRSSAPKPTSPSPSLSRSYSSSFGSSSASSSPSKSPSKSNSTNRTNSIKTGGSDASSKESGRSHNSRISLTSKRKSWVKASTTARSHNSRSPDKSNDSGEDIPDMMIKMSPKKETKNKISIGPRRPLKPSTESRPTKARVVIEENYAKRSGPNVRKRPQSAPNKKPIKSIHPPDPSVELGEFSKSLKLLGIDVPSNRTEASKLCNQEVKVETKEPTIRTRLLRRSGSYADLTKHVKKDMKRSEFEAVKSDLNNAIFEEWYFTKCEKERERKQKIKDEEEQKKKEEEEKKKEIEEQSKEEFDKWMKQKKKQAEKAKKKQEIIEKGKGPGKVVDKEEVERKRQEWLALKKKDLAKKKEAEEKKRKEEEEKRIEEDTKRTEAEKTFLAWKEKKTKELKERYLNEKKKQKKMEEDKIEKRKDADCAFNGWKNRKTEVSKEKKIKKEEVKPTNDASEEKSEGTNKKLEEAKLAYEAWLDFIEAREEEKLMFEEERKRILMWKPPWYPGGKALF